MAVPSHTLGHPLCLALSDEHFCCFHQPELCQRPRIPILGRRACLGLRRGGRALRRVCEARAVVLPALLGPSSAGGGGPKRCGARPFLPYSSCPALLALRGLSDARPARPGYGSWTAEDSVSAEKCQKAGWTKEETRT